MDQAPPDLIPRQIWVDPTPTSGSLPHSCTPFRLTSGGEINIGGGTIITLTQDAAFQPACPGTEVPPPVDPLQPGADLSVLDSQDPWYSSTNPQIYAISAVTIVSYMLLIILFITPRTFFVGGAGGGGGFLGQRGVVSGAYGSNSVIGIGSRPWLQKIAALTVAVSMTIVTANTFTWAHSQYDAGYQDATELTIKVVSSTEVRAVRVISETFLWLAQAQTLIRLFPRHKEKLLIKWIAFALIVLELIFTILNHFLVEGSSGRPRRFVSAVPALNYLFALTLNLCYGGFIIYYALQKRRFAFYHPHMRNMPLVALLSLTAVLIPVVFFVLDLSKPNISGWGNYVRWVGSAAASVVVWEWVERIEALERDEKKGGILGREIFDGYEMLDATPGSDVSWPSSNRRDDNKSKGTSGSGYGLSTGWSSMTARAREFGRYRRSQRIGLRFGPKSSLPRDPNGIGMPQNKESIAVKYAPHPAPPPAIASPTGRADNASAGSTLYVVRYHPNEPTPPIRGDIASHSDNRDPLAHLPEQRTDSWLSGVEDTVPTSASKRQSLWGGLQRLPNPFRRTRETPPPEVARALAEGSQKPGATQDRNVAQRTVLKRLHLTKTPKATGPPRPVIVVPAPPQRRSSGRSSMNDSLDNAESEADTELPVERSQSITDDTPTDRDADLPPDEVLNAMSHSALVCPLSGRVRGRSP